MCTFCIKSNLVAFLCAVMRLMRHFLPSDIRVVVRISTIRPGKASSALALSLLANGGSAKLSITRASGLKRSVSTVRKSRTGAAGFSSTATIPEVISPPPTDASSLGEKSAISSSIYLDGRGLEP